MRIIVTGSLGYDYIMNYTGRFADRIMPDKLHQISLSFLADKLTRQFGGTAVNVAYTLKLLGIEPHIVTCAGNDFAPYREFLTKNRIDTSGIIERANEPCSSYHVVTDRDDNQIGAYYIGASKYNTTLSLASPDALPVLVVIGPTDPKAMTRYVEQCQELGYPYFYDPAFQIGAFKPSALQKAIAGASVLIGNDYEIALIEQTLEVSHEELLVMGPGIVITTLGSKGSIIESRYDALHIKPAKPVCVSDPTGAGDAYRAGFLAGYCTIVQKKKLKVSSAETVRFSADELVMCGQMGSVAAVYTVEKYGTVTHHFTKNQFIDRFRKNFGTSLRLS